MAHLVFSGRLSRAGEEGGIALYAEYPERAAYTALLAAGWALGSRRLAAREAKKYLILYIINI